MLAGRALLKAMHGLQRRFDLAFRLVFCRFFCRFFPFFFLFFFIVVADIMIEVSTRDCGSAFAQILYFRSGATATSNAIKYSKDGAS